MQMYKGWLGSSQFGTVLGGWVGSLLFMCTLTAVGNLERSLFGKSFQQKLLPEGMYLELILLYKLECLHSTLERSVFHQKIYIKRTNLSFVFSTLLQWFFH